MTYLIIKGGGLQFKHLIGEGSINFTFQGMEVYILTEEGMKV